MKRYRVVSKQNMLYILADPDAGVPFDCLAKVVEQQQELSEFERFRAAKLIRSAHCEPYKEVTRIEDLALTPLFSLQNNIQDKIKCRFEMYLTEDAGAELRLGINETSSNEASVEESAQLKLSREEVMRFLSFFSSHVE